MQFKPSLGDVVVVGMVQDRHVIADISFNVPYGIDTTIPGHLAAQSKDLWRDIGQRKLFKKPNTVTTPRPPIPHHQSPKDSKQLEQLAKQVSTLQEENQALRDAMKSSSLEQTAKLDSILDAIKNGLMVSPGNQVPQLTTPLTTKSEEVVDGSAPTFLPSKIKPEGVEAHIDVQGESSDSNVSGTAAKLRALRKKKSN